MPVQNAEVGEEVFLQGNFINLGVNASGSLGTSQDAPLGFTTDTDNGFTRLGLFADTDGFGTGSDATFRDLTLPGTPVEGFSIGYKAGDSTTVLTNKERTGLTQISGDGDDISSGGIGRALWTGTAADSLSIRQTISVAENANYVRVDIVLTNVTGATLNDVRYMRNVDPDQAPGFVTDNEIFRQGEGGALIASYVPGGTFPFFYYSADARAVVSNYGFQNDDPYQTLAYDTPQPVGFRTTEDNGVNITFGLGDLSAGESASFTFYMGVTDKLEEVIDSIVPDLEENIAPVATDDTFTTDEDTALSGNVLANDTDADLDPLSATLISGVTSGVLTLNPDGTFNYTPNSGFSGTDSFSYRVSDGEDSDIGSVTITVESDDAPPPTSCPTVDRAGTQDGSSSASDVLTGAAFHNTFYFDNSAVSTGRDRISNFSVDDILVVSEALRDSNNDGIVNFGRNNVLNLGGDDTVRFDGGVRSLRFLGEACEGNFVYASAIVRPKEAIEGFVLSADFLSGDLENSRKDVFFFDTALDIDLGDDIISNFGSGDLVVTTTALRDGNGDGRITLGSNGVFDLTGGVGGPDDPGMSGEGGSFALTNTAGATVGVLEYDGSVVRNGVTYFVYSQVGSLIGAEGIG